MIELERHIEILLLSNDCVIVPGLGGFMTHHLEACYDVEDNMFLPPQRTLGFNPQLKLNDSLLAQSYVEAYDISYPEAVRRIEGEVTELKQHLENEGYYELNDIGQLTVNDEGNLEFEPCEAGILTPEFYGLSSFEMVPLHGAKAVRKVQDAIGLAYADEEEKQEHGERAITIRMSWIRNAVAVAAAVLAFFIMTKPVSNSEVSNVSMSQINLPIMQKESNPKTIEKADEQFVDVVLPEQEPEVVAETSPAEEKAVEETTAKEQPAEEKAVEAKQAEEAPAAQPQPQKGYCIVVASQVSKAGADNFVKELRKQGFVGARVYLYNNIRRVICGVYSTESEAYRQLQSVHRHEGLSEAWVYRMK